MKKRIITISREFGSGGRCIGKEIAEELGVKCYDKDIILELAEKTGFAKEFIENSAELAPNKGLFSYAFVGRDMHGRSVQDIIYQAQSQIILELADKEPCVIIGRNADYILKGRDDVLNVFIHGNIPEKTKRICELYQVSEKEALKMMKDVDKRRSANYNFYTEQEWGEAKNYMLTLNSSELGYETCEEIIIDCVR